MSVKINVIANFLGQGWTAAMGLLFIPLYIRYLGMETYGLIGLFALLQTWLALFDAGMTPTLTREMARFTAGLHSPQSIRNLLRSLEILCFSMAVVIAAALWGVSDYLASGWLKVEKLPIPVVAHTLSIMAFVVAARFVEITYRATLIGLQRQVWHNGANAVLSVLKHGGAAAILAWVWPTIYAFFLWHAFVSSVSILVFASKVHRVLPVPPSRPSFSRQSLKGIWKFAGGMMGVNIATMVLTQIDKVLLSRLLSLELFGYYSLAATIAGAAYLLVQPIVTAVYPSMIEFSGAGDHGSLVSVYHKGAQLVTVLTGSASMLLSCFAGGVVYVWSMDTRLAVNTAPILSALVLGCFLNGLMWMPIHCQLAQGWTSLVLKGNVAAAGVFIPAIYWIVPHYGTVGVAWAWVVINLALCLALIQLMHRRLIPKEKWKWYFADVLVPAGGVIGVMLLAKMFEPADYQNRGQWFFFLLITGSLALIVSTMLAGRIRPGVTRIINQGLSGVLRS